MKRSENAIYIGNTNKLENWFPIKDNELGENPTEYEDEKVIEKVQELLKNYLQLDNVNFLFGTGASIHLGAVSIQSIPEEIENDINLKDGNEKVSEEYETFKEVIQLLQKKELETNIAEDKKRIAGATFNQGNWKYIYDGNFIRDYKEAEKTKEVDLSKNYGNIALMFESLLNYLIAKHYSLTAENNVVEANRYDKLIKFLKKSLFKVCDIHDRKTSERDLKRIKEMGMKESFEADKYVFHEKFLKSLMQRPLNLQRANIFTSNYDLAFEYAFDNLGIKYIDGFSGFHHRYFKPETFNYDIFYPGSTTSGKVQRIEKVVRYFKLHGSISWINDNQRSATNIYGIEEMPLELIKLKASQPKDSSANSFNYADLMIYPSAVKKSYTLDLPYSELFRHFSYAISQPQSVLFTIGYSFCDEHFNDIIYQALTNPSFTLIIVDFNGTKKSNEIKRLKDLNDPRIIILEGNVLGDFLAFSNRLMPNFMDVSSSNKIAKAMNEILSNKE